MISTQLLRNASAACLLAVVLPVCAQTQPPASWPRHLDLAGGAVLVYPPQVTRWVDDAIAFRSAVALKAGTARDEKFGVVEVTASTHVDKVSRTVALADLKIVKVDFPTLPDRGASLQASIAGALPRAVGAVSLDRLQASLAATGFAPAAIDVSNTAAEGDREHDARAPDPDRRRPGVEARYGQRRLHARDQHAGADPEDPVGAADVPARVRRLAHGQCARRPVDASRSWRRAASMPLRRRSPRPRVVDLLDGGRKANPKPSLAQGVPAIYTSETPAELIVFKGTPDFAPIVGTALAWAANTTSDVVRDTTGNLYYVLLAGRWFRSTALSGPWTFVASDALPADFARIPPTSLAGAVLPAVAGTPQARAALPRMRSRKPRPCRARTALRWS